MKRWVWFGGLLALALAGSVQAQVQMAWKLKGGDKFWLETVSTTKQTMQTVGRDLKQDIEQTTAFAINVLEAAEGKDTVLEQKIEWVTVKVGGPMTAADDRFNQQLAGLTFKVTITPKGEVKLEDYAGLVAKIAGTDENAKKAVMAVLKEETLKQAIAEAFVFLPDKPVKTADTWERKELKPLGPIGTLDTLRKYSYDGQETVDGKALEKITFSGTANYTPPKPGEATPFQFTVVKGEMKVDELRGSSNFDATAGRLVKAEWSMKLSGVVTIAVGGTNIETKAVQDMTVKTRLLNTAPAKPGAAAPGGGG